MPTAGPPAADPMTLYYQRVAGEITEAMAQQGRTQNDLVEACRKEFSFEISQSTVSKIVRGKGNGINMATISAICQALRLDLAKVLTIRRDEAPETLRVPAPGEALFPDMKDSTGADSLIATPTHSFFKGYVDREYDIFYLSTASNENDVVTGVMRLSNEGNQYCKIYIQLRTDQNPQKEYVGQMMISSPRRACYCVVTSSDLGEQCCFIFAHQAYTQGSLKVRLAAATTVSAGNAQRPTTHRMAICERGVIDSEEKRRLIASQLLQNSAQIMISKANYAKLCQEAELAAPLQALKPRMLANEPYFTFEEADVLRLRNYGKRELVNLLTRLRESSLAKRYNKIANDADMLLYNYLFPPPR